MSDPKRLLSGGMSDMSGLGDFEKELLGSWQAEQPSDAARARAMAIVGLGLGAATATGTATTATAAKGRPSGRRSRRRGRRWGRRRS